MNLVYDKVLSRQSLETTLGRNGAQVASKSATKVVYRLSSGARAEVEAAASGQYRLRVLVPPGCACMK